MRSHTQPKMPFKFANFGGHINYRPSANSDARCLWGEFKFATIYADLTHQPVPDGPSAMAQSGEHP